MANRDNKNATGVHRVARAPMSQRQADMLLAFTSMVWGSSYLFMKTAIAEVPPFELTFLRFGIAFAITAVVFHRKFALMDRTAVLHGLVTGLLTFTLFGFLVYGLKTTSPSQAGFLTSMAVVFVPCIHCIVNRKRPSALMACCLVVCVAGIALMTLQGGLALDGGSVLCILGSLSYAIQIVLTDRFVRRTDAVLLGVLQMGFASAAGLAFTLAFETPIVPTGQTTWTSIMGLAVLCSAFGFVAQPAAQAHTSAEHTAFLFALEPVFAALFAFLFMGDVLSPRELAGAALILTSVLCISLKGEKTADSACGKEPGEERLIT